MLVIIAATIILSFLFAPMGCVLLWQRQAYFADGLAHACLLASSISIARNLPIIITSPIIAIIFVLLLFLTNNQQNNAAINLVSSLLLSAGIIIASTFPMKVNLNTLLLGDILSISNDDIAILSCLAFLSSFVLWKKLDDIVLFSLSPDLALVRGIKTKKLEITLLVILAIILSISMKIIGALLASAMLILPAFTAQSFARNPVTMIIYSTLLASICSIIGVLWSFYYDVPTGPAIIFSYGVLHFVLILGRKIHCHSRESGNP